MDTDRLKSSRITLYTLGLHGQKTAGGNAEPNPLDSYLHKTW